MALIGVDRSHRYDTSMDGYLNTIAKLSADYYAILFRGHLNDAYVSVVRTYETYNRLSTINYGYEFRDATTYYGGHLITVDGAVRAILYKTGSIYLCTLDITDLGIVTPGLIDEVTIAGSIATNFPEIIHRDGIMYLMLFGGNGPDGYLQTRTISALGDIAAAATNSWEFDAGACSNHSNLLYILGDVHAFAYRNSITGVTRVCTVKVTAAGAITNAFEGTLDLETGPVTGYLRLRHVAGNTYAVVYEIYANKVVKLVTVDITNGIITLIGSETYSFPTIVETSRPDFIRYVEGLAFPPTVGQYMIVNTVNIKVTYTIIEIANDGTIGATLETTDIASGRYPSIVNRTGKQFITAHGTMDYGWVSWIGLQPAATTQPVTDIAPGAAPGEGGTATGHGNVTELGEPDPDGHGHVWNTEVAPTTPYVDNGAVVATGAFTSAITRLKPGLTYYTRARVRTGSTTTYGNEESFVSDPTITKVKVRVNALDRGLLNVLVPDQDNVDVHAKRCMVKAPNGILWIAGINYFAQPNRTIYVYYSTDGGLTWTYEEVVATCSALYEANFVLLVDSDSVPIILFVDNSNDANEGIRYVDRRGGVWGAHEMVHATTSHWGLDAVIDATDVIHITLYSNDIIYIKGVSGSWDASEVVDAGGGWDPVIAVDSAGKPYVVYTSAITVLVLRERNGAWGAEEDIPGSTANAEYPSVAIDEEDNLHVVWKDYNADPYIFYNKRTVGVWGAHLVVDTDVDSEDYGSPSVTIDTGGTVYVVYDTERYWPDIRYRRIVAGVLSAEIVLDGDVIPMTGIGSLGSALYHRYPDSGILPAGMQPSIYQQEKRDADSNPDIYYVRPLVAAAPSGGIPGVVELLT